MSELLWMTGSVGLPVLEPRISILMEKWIRTTASYSSGRNEFRRCLTFLPAESWHLFNFWERAVRKKSCVGPFSRFPISLSPWFPVLFFLLQPAAIKDSFPPKDEWGSYRKPGPLFYKDNTSSLPDTLGTRQSWETRWLYCLSPVLMSPFSPQRCLEKRPHSSWKDKRTPFFPRFWNDEVPCTYKAKSLLEKVR